MDRYKIIDAKIQEGYALIFENNYTSACDKWLEAWEGIKELFAEGVAEDIYSLDDKYKWTQFISNYTQDLEMELHNAGIDDKAYHEKRIVYCQELIQWCKSDLTINNTRIGMAEAYFELGDSAAGEKVFTEWLRDDPDYGLGYVGWADCYRLIIDDKQYEKAEEILLTAYARSDLRNKIEVVESLITLYEEMDKPDKVKEYENVFSKLQRVESEVIHQKKQLPVKVVKIGRNEPCPCGSGKKYKKCCGA